MAKPGATAPLEQKTTSNNFPPLQLQVRTPFEPTLFPSGGRNYLLYELELLNFSNDPLHLRGLQVLDAKGNGEEVLAESGIEQLKSIVRPIAMTNADERLNIAAGRSSIAFLCLAFDGNAPVPVRLRHRLIFDNAEALGPPIGTRNTKLHILGAPVTGPDWTAADGPYAESHHRTGVFVADGLAYLSRRYAIDWKKIVEGTSFSGDALDVRSYHAFGEPVVAVSEATVVRVKDGYPNNVPRTAAGFNTAVPVTMETIAGNFVVLDLGDGQFAFYAHLQPGSIRVRVGDRVKRGQRLASIGNSGDSREPHLHFQVSTSADGILAGEGVPYLIDHFRVKSVAGDWDTRTNEFPMGQQLMLDFDRLQ